MHFLPSYCILPLSGNPLAMAAGFATLDSLGVADYDALEAKGARLAAGLSGGPAPANVQRVGSMMTVFFGDGPMRNIDDVATCDTDKFARWHRGMLERGVYLPPSQYEAFFVSLAHSDADIDAVIAAHREVCETL